MSFGFLRALVSSGSVHANPRAYGPLDSTRNQFSINVSKGMTVSGFLLHREQAEISHRESHDGHIKLYVTWKKAVALVEIDISQWQLQRFSSVQRRYTKGPVQLVMCRVTCTQRKIDYKCRSRVRCGSRGLVVSKNTILYSHHP